MSDKPTIRERLTRPGSIMAIALRALRQHAGRTAATAVVIVASIALEVVPPLALAAAVDSLTRNVPVSLGLALGYFALIACSGLADALREALIVASGESITHELRSALMAKIRRLPAGYFVDHEAGTIASLQVDDVDSIEDLFSSGIVSMICDLGTVLAILVTVFTKSVGLGILLLIALPPLSIFTAHVQRSMLDAHVGNREASARASGILPETLHCIRSIHTYRAEDFAERRYDEAIQDSFLMMERTNFYDATYSPVILTASAVVIAIMMSLSGLGGAFRSLFGMSVGTAVALISYVNGIFTPLSSIGMEIQTVQSAAAGWHRVQAFLDEEERPVREPVSALAVQGAGTPAIEVRDLSFSYEGGHQVLDGFSLSVAPGEVVTLMGRTGAGKSTLFKLLLGLYDPAGGSIRIGGRDPRDIVPEERRHAICCVEQQVTPVPGSIRDQVTLGDDAYGDDAVWQALETVGLSETVAALPGGLDAPYEGTSLSQGQKQLLMIARAIVSDPQVLLLDEVTAGLDGATEQMVAEALLRASADRTVLSISHRLSATLGGRIVDMPL